MYLDHFAAGDTPAKNRGTEVNCAFPNLQERNGYANPLLSLVLPTRLDKKTYRRANFCSKHRKTI